MGFFFINNYNSSEITDKETTKTPGTTISSTEQGET